LLQGKSHLMLPSDMQARLLKIESHSANDN
jgi:hypothetical protein